MIKGNLSELEMITSGRPLSKRIEPVIFNGLSIDSRSISPGNLFVAIKGRNDDGHKYIENSHAKGAPAFIIEQSNEALIPEDIKPNTIVVDDTKQALQKIAYWWRKKFHPQMVAVTGTNGKTTTKEMIADILSKKYQVFRSPGNFNNLYGIPLSLCMLNDTSDVCVLELGMSYPGEISILTRMVEPDFALITNVGPAHLETLGKIENIARAKFELLENSAKSTLRILNLDDPWLSRRFEIESEPKMGYAVYADADVRPSGFSSNTMGRIIFEYEDQKIHLLVSGLHNLYNALAACAVGRALDVDSHDIKSALECFRSKSSRMEIIRLKEITIIDDSYNANPTSMGYALQVLHNMEAEGRKIAVLGDMKELGREEVEMHQDIGQLVAEIKPDLLITVGRLGMHIASQANLEGFDPGHTRTYMAADEAAECLISEVHKGDQILIKASRAMNFDNLVTKLKKFLGKES